MARTLIKGDQIQITDFIKALAAADWNSDTLTVSAAAILAKIQSEIAGVTGAWPTISGGNAQSGKYVSGITISNGMITVTKADLPTLPDYRQYRVEGETPSGNIDGDNRTFVTNYKPLAEKKIAVYLNGVRQKEGDGNDYQVSIPTSGTNTGKGVIVFESNANYPKPGDTLLVDYTTMDPITAN